MKVDISPKRPPMSSWTAAAPSGSGSLGGGSSLASRSMRRIILSLLVGNGPPCAPRPLADHARDRRTVTGAWQDGAMVHHVEPMLATLSDRREFDDHWVLERKLDGVRLVGRRDGGDVVLLTRTGRDVTATYPEVRDALAAQRATSFVVDGEGVAFEGDASSFSRLQQRLGVARPTPALVREYPVVLCAFDLLALGGADLRDDALVERRARLTDALAAGPALQQTEHWRGGEARERFAAACAAGWEGLIAKRAAAPY